MEALLALLARWGYVILAAFVVAEQVPLPVPAERPPRIALTEPS
jgi:hypothetical protein